ncbi:MAG: hypothetical protein GXP46_09945 [Deferribacteres bacterium]|nr:hypothetical protein [Deferribacteres bacterium]
MIVFDSSTLILLARIDMLETLVSNYHGAVLIPEKVKSEVCLKGREETPVVNKMIKDKKIRNIKLKNRKHIKKLSEDFNIDAGEAEALLLALQEGAGMIATDDRNAIRACKILKLDFVTAVAFLIRLFEKGLIERDDALLKLQKLQVIGRYSRAIIEDAAKQIQGG